MGKPVLLDIYPTSHRVYLSQGQFIVGATHESRFMRGRRKKCLIPSAFPLRYQPMYSALQSRYCIGERQPPGTRRFSLITPNWRERQVALPPKKRKQSETEISQGSFFENWKHFFPFKVSTKRECFGK